VTDVALTRPVALHGVLIFLARVLFIRGEHQEQHQDPSHVFSSAARETQISSLSFRAKTHFRANAGWLQTTSRPRAFSIGSRIFALLITRWPRGDSSARISSPWSLQMI